MNYREMVMNESGEMVEASAHAAALAAAAKAAENAASADKQSTGAPAQNPTR